MENLKNKKAIALLLGIFLFSFINAQNYESKTKDSGHQDKRVEIHGDLNLTYQGLDQSNVNGKDVTDGFLAPSANLDFRVKVVDGVILNTSIWLSSQHHKDTYMGFADITVDKFNFLKLGEGATEFLNDHVRVKSGIGNPNFGDAWLMRSTNAHTIENPFQTNNLMDAFTTSLFGEAYYFFNQRDFLMAGITDGASSLSVSEVSEDENSGSDAALYAKVAKTFKLGSVDSRTAISFYKQLGSDGNQNLYYGDRAGYPMNKIFEGGDFGGMMGKSGTDLSSLRIDQSFKYSGFSLLGSYELAEATWNINSNSVEGQMYQITAMTTYDFNKKLYVGASYNYVGSDFEQDYDSSKYEAVIGYQLLPKTTLKASYFYQKMNNDFVTDSDGLETPIVNGKADGLLLGVNISF